MLNAPVFIRVVLKLQKIRERNATSLPLIQHTNHVETNVQAQRDLFTVLSKIVRMIFASRDEKTDTRLIQSFRKKYETLYLQGNDWIEHDPEKFYINLMDILRTAASDANQMELYSKAFNITSSISIDGGESEVKKEHVVHISANHDDFPRCINEQYVRTNVRSDKGHMIKQEYGSLPEQLVATDQKSDHRNNVPCTYPTEFQTCNNQRYMLTGVVAVNNVSFNCPSHIAMERRQDSVYLFNSRHLIDRFHSDYLLKFLESVIPT